MVSRIPSEGKGDTSSESGQVNATEAIPNINRGPYVKGKYSEPHLQKTRASQATRKR
jgi:hypothetical protein